MVDVCNIPALDADTEREYRELAQAMAERESLRLGYGAGLVAELRKVGRFGVEIADDGTLYYPPAVISQAKPKKDG